MLSPIEMGAAVTAGFGGITMLWGNIRGAFARLESFVVVKAELGSGTKEDFMDYCWTHFKSSPMGIRKFYSMNTFIKPKNRSGRVCAETTGLFVTFWSGYKPLFCSLNKEYDTCNISFIRGTFDLEKILIDATNHHDNFKHDKEEGSTRYYVRRCFGKTKGYGVNDTAEQPAMGKAHSSSHHNPEEAGFRPLFYSKEDLGAPTSKKPMDNLAYETSVQEFYDEVVRWKNSKEWFEEKGLPWRFGAGLFGPPGSGKTSLARAIGQSLDMPIHSYDLITMNNEELTEYWQNSLNESPCIVLLEDIDRIFDENKQIKTNKNKSPLTLDCLLNCISGVQPSDGILVLVTANDVTKLDPALGVPDSTGKSTRPGRLDRAVYVGILNKEGRQKIAGRILSDYPELIESVVLEGDGETGAQFESRCAKIALSRFHGGFKVYGEQIGINNPNCAAHSDYPASGMCTCS